MSNVGALYAHSNNKPLRTIVEATNSDDISAPQGDSRWRQYEDMYRAQAARLGPEEWQSMTSDSSSRVDGDHGSPNADVRLPSAYIGPRTRQAFSPMSDGSDHVSAQRSSQRGSGTGSIAESNTEATSAMQQSLKEDLSDNEEHLVAPRDEFDLAAPIKDGDYLHSLETLSELLFAREHLKYIFADPSSLLDFTSFLRACRPQSIPMLMYHLDTTEALKAVTYALTIAKSLEPIKGHEFTSSSTETTLHSELEDRAEKAFDVLVEEELPAFVIQLYVQTVKSSMTRRILGPSASPVQEGPEGLLEVFCLTDPSRPDNPIVFASEAFHRMTQYSMSYVIGRNCRFLQGPKTNKSSMERIRKALQEGQDHCELILNYRRDGSPFLNLLMLAPLRDITGKIRYVLGAQIDVSNLVPNSTEMDEADSTRTPQVGFVGATMIPTNHNTNDELRDLNGALDAQDGVRVLNWRAGTAQEERDDDSRSTSSEWQRPGVLSRGLSSASLPNNDPGGWVNSRLSGFYPYYLLIRPYPSLRVLFASPSLRIPGILQSCIMDRIEVSPPVHDELTQALAQGRSVTAKVRWVTSPGGRARNQWIAFTPLVGSHEQVGVWIAILVDDEYEKEQRVKQAPPVKFRAGTTNRIPPLKKSAPTPKQSWAASDIDRLPDEISERSVALPDRPISSANEPQPASSERPVVGRSIVTPVLDNNESYETLEERLRKKRLRDAARLLEQPGAPVKPTYKSLSPYAFMNNDVP